MNFVPTLENAFIRIEIQKSVCNVLSHAPISLPFLVFAPQRKNYLKKFGNKTTKEVHHHLHIFVLKLFWQIDEIPVLRHWNSNKEKKKKIVLLTSIGLKKLILQHSWWDSIDTIAKYILGAYLQQFPPKLRTLSQDFQVKSMVYIVVWSFSIGIQTKKRMQISF
jgi:hypothetical protein